MIKTNLFLKKKSAKSHHTHIFSIHQRDHSGTDDAYAFIARGHLLVVFCVIFASITPAALFWHTFRSFLSVLSVKDLEQERVLMPRENSARIGLIHFPPPAAKKENNKFPLPFYSSGETVIVTYTNLRAEHPSVERPDGHRHPQSKSVQACHF